MTRSPISRALAALAFCAAAALGVADRADAATTVNYTPSGGPIAAAPAPGYSQLTAAGLTDQDGVYSLNAANQIVVPTNAQYPDPIVDARAASAAVNTSATLGIVAPASGGSFSRIGLRMQPASNYTANRYLVVFTATYLAAYAVTSGALHQVGSSQAYPGALTVGAAYTESANVVQTSSTSSTITATLTPASGTAIGPFTFTDSTAALQNLSGAAGFELVQASTSAANTGVTSVVLASSGSTVTPAPTVAPTATPVPTPTPSAIPVTTAAPSPAPSGTGSPVATVFGSPSAYASGATNVVNVTAPVGFTAGQAMVLPITLAQTSIATPPVGWQACSARMGSTTGGQGMQIFVHTVVAGETGSYAFPLSATSAASAELYTISGAASVKCEIAKEETPYVAAPSQTVAAGGLFLGAVATRDGSSANDVAPATIFPSSISANVDGQAIPPTFATTVFSEAIVASGAAIAGVTFPNGYVDNVVAASVAVQPGTALALPPAALGPQEMPRQADFVADIAGANVHLGENYNLYVSPSAVESMVGFLHVRHLRDGMFPTNGGGTNTNGETAASYPEAETRRLHALYGVTFDDLTGFLSTANDMTQWYSFIGGAMDSAEGPNECDTSGCPNWAATDQAIAKLAYATLHPLGIRMLAPTLTQYADFGTLGDLSSYVDACAMHPYAGSFIPDGPTYGGGTAVNGITLSSYGGLAWNLSLGRFTCGAKPIEITENGYGDFGPSAQSIDPATRLAYYPRALLVDSEYRVAHDYFYEMLNEGTDGFQLYGLFDATAKPKPVAYEIANFEALFSDPGATFAPAPFGIAIGSSDAALSHVLTQKRDGSIVLALWQERSVFDPQNRVQIVVPNETVALTFGTAPTAVYQDVTQPDGSLVRTPLAASTSMSIAVGTSPVYLEINPRVLPALVTVPTAVAPASASRPFRRY